MNAKRHTHTHMHTHTTRAHTYTCLYSFRRLSPRGTAQRKNTAPLPNSLPPHHPKKKQKTKMCLPKEKQRATPFTKNPSRSVHSKDKRWARARTLAYKRLRESERTPLKLHDRVLFLLCAQTSVQTHEYLILSGMFYTRYGTHKTLRNLLRSKTRLEYAVCAHRTM